MDDPRIAPATARARHVRGPHPQRHRGHPRPQGRRPRRAAPRRPVGRGRGRPGHDLERRARVLQPQGRAQPAPVRVVPRRPSPLGGPGPGRAAGRRPRSDGPVRADRARSSCTSSRSSRAGSGTSPSGSRRSRPGSPRRACSTPRASDRCRRGPASIAVITSPSGAVWRDIRHVLARRWPLVEVVLVAAAVQGEDAPGEHRRRVPAPGAARGRR